VFTLDLKLIKQYASKLNPCTYKTHTIDGLRWGSEGRSTVYKLHLTHNVQPMSVKGTRTTYQQV